MAGAGEAEASLSSPVLPSVLSWVEGNVNDKRRVGGERKTCLNGDRGVGGVGAGMWVATHWVSGCGKDDGAEEDEDGAAHFERR